MEETKELQNVYKIFRTLIYVTLLIEFFVYAMPYQTLASMGTLMLDFHDRLAQFAIYRHGNLIYSKLVTLFLVIITCIGIQEQEAYRVRCAEDGVFPIGSRTGIGGIVRMGLWLEHDRKVLCCPGKHLDIYAGLYLWNTLRSYCP